VRSIKTILTIGVLLALLTVYVYVQANTETFTIYLIALGLWTGLFGYCVRSRSKQTLKIDAKH
jgi:hypothetical protein